MIRLIPKLEIKGPNLVKGVQLEGLRVLGKPWNFAKYYYKCGADELIFQDVVASLYGRNTLNEIIKKTSKEIFVPLTVGGGIRSLNDIEQVLHSGADKVSLNTMAVKNPHLIYEAAKTFGSSTIVIAIEYLRNLDGDYFIFTDNGREKTGINAMDWISKIQDLGSGEIIITSIERDGTGRGLDIDFLKKIEDKINVPLIINGGASCSEDLIKAFNFSSLNGVALGSILHYEFLKMQPVNEDHFSDEGNIDFIKKILDIVNLAITISRK